MAREIQHMGGDQYRQYNPERNFGKGIRKDCSPTILDKDTLMTEDGDYIESKKQINQECLDCQSSAVCKEVFDLLRNDKYEEAMNLLLSNK